MRSLSGHAPEQRGRGASPHAIALMRALRVVVAHEAVESPLQCRSSGEVAPSERHAPKLLENRALQSFDKPVGPGMARFRAGVPQAQLATGDIKRSLEFRAAVGEDAPHRPAGALEVRHDDHAQERGRGLGIVGRQQPASPYDVAASQAVICQTLPTPLRLPM